MHITVKGEVYSPTKCKKKIATWKNGARGNMSASISIYKDYQNRYFYRLIGEPRSEFGVPIGNHSALGVDKLGLCNPDEVITFLNKKKLLTKELVKEIKGDYDTIDPTIESSLLEPQESKNWIHNYYGKK